MVYDCGPHSLVRYSCIQVWAAPLKGCWVTVSQREAVSMSGNRMPLNALLSLAYPTWCGGWFCDSVNEVYSVSVVC